MKCSHFTCHQCRDGTEHIKSLVSKYKSISKGRGEKNTDLTARLELRNQIWEAALNLVPDNDDSTTSPSSE